MNIVIVSVVRDFAMYEKCIRTNPYCRGCEFAPIDNREMNAGIPVGYNSFLASRSANEDAWYVFCHEDWQPLENLGERFVDLDRESLWGVIGASTRVRWGIYHQWQLLGTIEECQKDGRARRVIGTAVEKGCPVETFDCQCLIVHSSLIRRHHLRFDECLTFDLYVEDFCIAAKERAGVISRVLPLLGCHWSGGRVLPRYYEQEAYLNDKWIDSCYTGTSSWVLGGRPSILRMASVKMKTLLRKVLEG